MLNVSVIVPNYNHADFLHKRLETVLNQSYPPYEIIILDDCSTDASRNVIEQYRNNDKVTHIVYNEQNTGSFSQWKRGIELAQSNYIWIAESDDYAHPDFLKTLMKRFEEEDELVLSYCRSRIVNAHGQDLGLHRWMDKLDSERWTADYVEDGPKEVHDYLNFRNTICNASSVVFKKPQNVAAIIPLNMEYCGDWFFWRKLLAKKGKVAYTHLPLSFFREHRQTSRAVTDARRETKRFKEYQSFIKVTDRLFFESRYDWMLREWIERRHLLVHFPHKLNLSLRIRYAFLLGIWHIKSCIKRLVRMLPKEGFLFRSLHSLYRR